MLKKFALTIGLCLISFYAFACLWFFVERVTIKQYWISENQKPIRSNSFIYVALGDSVTQGIGSSRIEKSYVKLLAKKISKHIRKPVRVINLSVSGDEIEDVIEKQVPLISHYKPDLITVAIGGNDLLRFHSRERINRELALLAERLPEGAYIADLPNACWYPASLISMDSVSYMRALVKKNKLKQIRIHDATSEHYWELDQYAYDLIHPSDKQHAIWAETFWKEIEKDL